MIDQLSSIVSRVLFAGAFVLGALAVLDKVLHTFGYALAGAGGQQPRRFLEIAAFALLFVIALQLREVKRGLADSGDRGERTAAEGSNQ